MAGKKQRKVVSRSQHVDPAKVGHRIKGVVERVRRGVVEAQWACDSCDTEGILARIKVCPNCGSPKGKTETYQPPEPGAPLLDDGELAKIGATRDHSRMDILCAFCGTKNRPDAERCKQCGASFVEEEPETIVPVRTRRPTQPTKKVNFWPYILGLLAVIAIVFILVAVFRPREDVLMIDSVAWTRLIYVQEHQHNRHEGWSLPQNADSVSQERRIHHYEDVFDHYEHRCHPKEECETVSTYSHTEVTCYDDGTCDSDDIYVPETICRPIEVCGDEPVYREEPVYQTWYTYMVWEWVNISPLSASGENNSPHWPSSGLPANQRETGRKESYSVSFVNEGGKSFLYSPQGTDEFSRLEPGEYWEVERNSFSVIQLVKELDR